ncbi:NAD(P)/FAD-dependent oxidoreductase [Pacificoceanicola onchidii]|uniref:NAD(P)/FAD-dependent oxidoreductase n=1 Tax=Pacificoceanicola onchidii TaxID=2562685 RepID=UPI0010A61A32|nr:FAD-dependent monooxygenase [Pacificoceanicola onchidii]
MTSQTYDAIVVGAGPGGAASAILLARQGLNVLAIDRKPDEDTYKKVCTTFIQRSALPVIEKLGLKEKLDAAGAIQNACEIWTEYGWIKDEGAGDPSTAHGYSVRRKVMDPLLLELMQAEPTLTLELGATLTELHADETGTFCGLTYATKDGPQTAHARQIVLADGRGSPGAKLAGVPTKMRENNRFVYYSYYENMPLKTGKTAQFWQTGRDMGFAYPFDGDLTMLCAFVCEEDFPEWKADRRTALESFFKDLPNAPDQSTATPASEIRGMRKLHDYWRPATYQGLALVGDACMSCDPMSGVGCGFAMQAADWMAERVGPALVSGKGHAEALNAYAKQHKSMLAGHEYFIRDASSGREANLLEKLISRAAVRDAVVAHRVHLFVGRVIKWQEFLSPGTLGRILLANLRGAPRTAPELTHVRG